MYLKKSLLLLFMASFITSNLYFASGQAGVTESLPCATEAYEKLMSFSKDYGQNSLIAGFGVSISILAWLGVHSYFQNYAERAEDLESKLPTLQAADIPVKKDRFEQLALKLGGSRLYNFLFCTNPLHKAVCKYLNQVSEKDKTGSKTKTLEVIKKILFGFGWGNHYLSEL